MIFSVFVARIVFIYATMRNLKVIVHCICVNHIRFGVLVCLCVLSTINKLVTFQDHRAFYTSNAIVGDKFRAPIVLVISHTRTYRRADV